ncbi:MAG: TerB family tellurite resistance protein [Burkholderiaceae bacterium]|nr:TerB family tellurite resistance protein [Burkholderiaceae bacterium]
MSKHSSSTRRYPRNSPQAAANIVALALISNGEVKPSEVAVLEAMRVHEQLGLTRQEWHDVVHELCIDLLGSATHGTDCQINGRMIERMLADIDDVALQRRVLRLCTAVINADRQVDEGESVVLLAAIDHWGLHPEEHELLEPLLYGLDFQVASRGARCNRVPTRSEID